MNKKMCIVFALCFLVRASAIEVGHEGFVETVEQDVRFSCLDFLLESFGIEICNSKRGQEENRQLITVGNIPEGYSQYLRDIKHQKTLDFALQAYKIKNTGLAVYGLATQTNQRVDKEQFRLGLQGAIETLELLKNQDINNEDKEAYSLAVAEAEGGVGMMQQSEIVLNGRDMFKKPWGCC